MNNWDYPEGADNSKAPWNEGENVKESFDVEVSQVLTKRTTVSTNDYELIDNGPDEDGLPDIEYNTDSTNWNYAYVKDHYTPESLIHECKMALLEYAKLFPQSSRQSAKYRKVMDLINECEDWDGCDLEVYKDE